MLLTTFEFFWTALVGHNGEFCTQQFKSLQCIDASIWNVSKIYFATKYVLEFTILYFAPHRAQSFPKKERWFSLQSFSKVLWLVWSSASLPLWANSYFFLYEMIKHSFHWLTHLPKSCLIFLVNCCCCSGENLTLFNGIDIHRIALNLFREVPSDLKLASSVNKRPWPSIQFKYMIDLLALSTHL